MIGGSRARQDRTAPGQFGRVPVAATAILRGGADPVVPMGPLLEVIPESHSVKRMVLSGAGYFVKVSNGVECGTNIDIMNYEWS